MSDTTEQIAILCQDPRQDFEAFLDRRLEEGLHWVDLKDGIYGKRLLDLSDEEAKKARRAMKHRGIKAYCLTSDLFHATVDGAEPEFRAEQLGPLPRLLELATVFKPMFVSIGSVRTEARADYDDINDFLNEEAPWVYDAYADAAEMIAGLRFRAAIDNEAESILVQPGEILRFFQQLGGSTNCLLSWDIQNSARSGLTPSREVFEALKPVLGYVRVSGGRATGGRTTGGRTTGGRATGGRAEGGRPGSPLYQSTLEEASWPVRDLTSAIVESGLSPVICLCASAGAAPVGFDAEAALTQDVRFVKSLIRETEARAAARLAF